MWIPPPSPAESVPLEAGKGTQLLSGMVNGETLLKVKVTSRFENSAASRIIAMVQDAASRKGSSEKFITRFARVYTPIVVVLAILLAVLPPLFGMGAFTEWLQRALVFLVASCPCALVISVPAGLLLRHRRCVQTRRPGQGRQIRRIAFQSGRGGL